VIDISVDFNDKGEIGMNAEPDYLYLYLWGLPDLKNSKGSIVFCFPYSIRLSIPPQLDKNLASTKAVVLVSQTAEAAGKASTGGTVVASQFA